jgi:hypothetical protein
MCESKNQNKISYPEVRGHVSFDPRLVCASLTEGASERRSHGSFSGEIRRPLRRDIITEQSSPVAACTSIKTRKKLEIRYVPVLKEYLKKNSRMNRSVKTEKGAKRKEAAKE